MYMYKKILFIAFILMLEAILVWRPFNSTPIAYRSSWKNKAVAGQITNGYHLTQEVPAKLLKTPVPKAPITHWWRSHRKLYTHSPNCFAIRFASYNRINNGRISVSSKQGNNTQKWFLNAREVRNNYKRFCPSNGLTDDQPLQVTINGISGKTGSSATVWLSHSKGLKPALINGRRIGDRSLHLQLVYFRHMGPDEIFAIKNGAFAFVCFISLTIAALVILTLRKRNA